MEGERAREIIKSRADGLFSRLEDNQIEHIIATSVGSVCHLTGYDPPIEVGRTPFDGGPALVYLSAGNQPVLVVPDMELAAAGDTAVGCELVAYASYRFDEPLAPETHLQAALLEIVGRGASPTGSLGVERSSLPLHLHRVLAETLPRLALEDVSDELAGVRVIKDPLDLERLRAVLHLCDVGQEACRSLARPGMSELELFAKIRGRMEVEAGGRIPLWADLCSGPRSGEAGGPPTGRVVAEGDWIQCDLVPRYRGYWGDSCNGVVVGRPTREQERLQSIAREALAVGRETLEPGVRARDLDRVLRDVVGQHGFEYPHHSGHGLGMTFHEEPRIVPDGEAVLAPNMVLALEPAVYVPGVGGVRLEHVFRVTDDGAELLSEYEHVM